MAIKASGNGAKFDFTQITLRSDLFSQIRGSIVILRDRIHKELGHTTYLSSLWLSLVDNENSKLQVVEQGGCSVDWFEVCKQLLESAISRVFYSGNQDYRGIEYIGFQS